MQIIAQLEATQSHWLANYTWNKKLQLLLNRNDKWFVKIKKKQTNHKTKQNKAKKTLNI